MNFIQKFTCALVLILFPFISTLGQVPGGTGVPECESKPPLSETHFELFPEVIWENGPELQQMIDNSLNEVIETVKGFRPDHCDDGFCQTGDCTPIITILSANHSRVTRYFPLPPAPKTATWTVFVEYLVTCECE